MIILVISAILDVMDKPKFNNKKSKIIESKSTPNGLTKEGWEDRCQMYMAARSDCAVAAKVSQCVEIKIGEADLQCQNLLRWLCAKIFAHGYKVNMELIKTTKGIA